MRCFCECLWCQHARERVCRWIHGARAACLVAASAISVRYVRDVRRGPACPLRLCACLGGGSLKATGLHGFSRISYSSLPFLKTHLPSAAGAESEWPLHFTPEVASFQQWVSDPGVRTL